MFLIFLLKNVENPSFRHFYLVYVAIYVDSGVRFLPEPYYFLTIKSFNPKRAGLFGPISQPGGGEGGFRPPKISETD